MTTCSGAAGSTTPCTPASSPRCPPTRADLAMRPHRRGSRHRLRRPPAIGPRWSVSPGCAHAAQVNQPPRRDTGRMAGTGQVSRRSRPPVDAFLHVAVRSLLHRRPCLPAQGGATGAAAPARPGRGDPHAGAVVQRRWAADGEPTLATAAAEGAQGQLRAVVRGHDHSRARPLGRGVPASPAGLAAPDPTRGHRGRNPPVADRRQPRGRRHARISPAQPRGPLAVSGARRRSPASGRRLRPTGPSKGYK